MVVLHHHEGRLVVARDGARQGAETAVLGLRGQRQADGPLGVGGIVEYHRERRVLLVAAHLRAQAEFLERLKDGPQVGFLLELGFVIHPQLDVGQHVDHARVAEPPLQLVEHLLVLVQVQQERAQLRALQHRPSALEPLPVEWISSRRFSVARRMISRVNSFSSLMYFSLLPFLMR